MARALPFQTRRTLIYRISARMARAEIERARQLVSAGARLGPVAVGRLHPHPGIV